MSSFLVFLCKSKFFPTCICPFTYVDISSTSLWYLSEEPFQSPLPTLDFLSWPSSYFFSFSREILYQHLQHNCQLTFVVMSVKCFLMGCSLCVLPIRLIPECLSTGLRAMIQEFSAGIFHWTEDDLSASVHWCVLWEWYSHLGAFMTTKWLNILVERSALERELVPAEFFFKIPLSLFSAVECGI